MTTATSGAGAVAPVPDTVDIGGTVVPVGGKFFTVGDDGPHCHGLTAFGRLPDGTLMLLSGRRAFNADECLGTLDEARAVAKVRAEWNLTYHRDQAEAARRTLDAIDGVVILDDPEADRGSDVNGDEWPAEELPRW